MRAYIYCQTRRSHVYVGLQKRVKFEVLNSKFFLCNNHGPFTTPEIERECAFSLPHPQTHTLCHSEHEKHGPNGLFFVPFLFLPPHPNMKSAASLAEYIMFVFLFSPSPILSMNNAAEMALFTCLTPLSLNLIPTRKIWTLWPHFSSLGTCLIPIQFRA